MNNEKLKTANDLSEAIVNLNRQKQYWDNAVRIDALNLTWKNSEGYSCYNSVNTDYVNFEVLRTLTLATINKKLQALETEFENL